MHREVIKLKCGDWCAKIDLAHGANCISLKNKKYGASLLREPPENTEPDNPYLYGMPILFPVNRIEDGCFEFEGRKYTFPINEQKTNCHLHGEMHKTPFEALEVTDSKIKCTYRATKDMPYLTFPHEFEIIMSYELKESGFYHTATVINRSTQNMPIFLGFHTTFNTLFTKNSRPQNIRAVAEICEEYERNMEINYLPTGKILPFDAVSQALAEGRFSPFSEKISRHYRAAGKMGLSDLGIGVQMVYENDEKYKFRLIYNGADDGYISLEPQNCLANCQNSPFDREYAGFDFLKPDESKTYNSKIFMEEIKYENNEA
jgi:aldose 1-epimerase